MTPAGRRRRRLRRPLSFVDVVTLTLPLFVFAGWLLWAPVHDYAQATRFDDWWSHSARVHRFAWLRARTALSTPRFLELERRLDPAAPHEAALRLFVDRAEFDALAARVPGSLDTWFDAQIAHAGRFHPVELRFRGDTSAHWTASKKSLTVKTGRDDLFKGYRRLILTLKEVLPQYTLGRLARELDLLTPDTAVVPVFLNDRFHGIHRFVEPIDESFLRHRGQMPGNVYRADRAERGEYLKNLPRGVFRDPRLWDRVARNDRPGATGDRALAEFLAAIWEARSGDPAVLTERLDTDEIARLLALCLIAGDPYHMSAVHNQFWYEEPASATFHPIVWDLRLLDLGTRPEPLNPFWVAVLRDPTVWHRALAELAVLLRDDGFVRRAEAIARRAFERYREAFEYDRLRAGLVSDVGHPDEIVRTLARNAALLEGWIGDARAAFATVDRGTALTIDVELRGFASIELRGFLFEFDAADGQRAPLGGRLWADRDGAGPFEADADEVLPGVLSRVDGGVSLLLTEPLTLHAGVDTSGVLVEPDRLAYRFFMPLGPGDTAPRVRPICTNAHTGEPVELEPLAPGTLLAAAHGRHPWSRRAPEPETVVWSGRMQLTEDWIGGPETTLVIEPGTTLTLAPDVSIVLRGPVEARGTAELPIRVARADAARPWGVFALQGPDVAGSRLRYVAFDGGGGDLVGGVEYKGMVCVYWGRDVRLERCSFERNVRCDDGLNVVQSTAVDVESCRFEALAADAIDYDHSTGTIARSTIRASGNDGIDLMSCGPQILGNVIEGSGDKGISIGEDAAPLVFDNRIAGCARGLEVKDGSEPLILHTDVEGCELGLLQHAKNWRYGSAGWAKVVASRFADNGIELEMAPAARVTLTAPDPAVEEPALPWILARAGVAPAPGAAAGRVADWSERPPLRPRAALDFREDFGDPTAGFGFGGGVTRLVTVDRTLEARVRREVGRIGTRLDWTCDPGGGRAVLLLEYATENLGRLAVRLDAADEDGREIALTGGARSFRYAVVALAGGAVPDLIFECSPGARSDVAGRLVLRSVELLQEGAP